MQPMRDRQGIAIVVALTVILLLSVVSTLMFTRSINDLRTSRDNTAMAQAINLARGGAVAATALMSSEVRASLEGIVRSADPSLGGISTSDIWYYGGNATQPIASTVAARLALLANTLQTSLNAAICNRNFAPDGSGATVQVRVHFTTAPACGQAFPASAQLPSGYVVDDDNNPATPLTRQVQGYALPYVMVVTASPGTPYQRNVMVQGEYRFLLTNGSFARYALFTNRHRTRSNRSVWFTSNTLFDGPVHTNERFNFSFNPWFGGYVTSAGCTNAGASSCAGSISPGAFFGSGNNTTFLSPSQMTNPNAPSWTSNGITHAPIFEGNPRVNWQEPFIPMPDNNQNQRNAAQTGGLYFNSDIARITLYAGDASGTPPTCNASGVCTPATSPYQYIEVCLTAACTGTNRQLYRYDASGTLYRFNGSWPGVLVRVGFNGMIFADGSIDNLTGPARSDASNPNTAPPALASFAQITVANAGSGENIRIQGDLKYQSPACSGTPTRNGGTVTRATCNNLSADNILGVYSQDGDILLGNGTNTSLQDLTIHGVLMTSRGEVAVQNYNSIAPRGAIRLQGGIIQYTYGAFGQFNSSTGQMIQGYARQFTYDPRMQDRAPPFFPTTGVVQVSVATPLSFGQREQVY
ncbi:DUF4900 domain-containing protein [Meiothermus taiwanensis]|uniref:DUF4900 domain-containing protein n=1 Tax=Meiothermus taiwanensis TaxID=172827 RepID=A0A399E6W4_9DEIN|nr:DUF4900 domain-containing protein [Meiothermus taiwanensis]RIH79253.1 hypothetical protein Mcate_00427 [Meiothermus taiwanensis]